MSSPHILPAPVAESPFAEGLRVYGRNPSAVAGLVMLAIIVSTAIWGPIFQPADPFEIRVAPFVPPGTAQAWLGSDYLGRDLLIALVHGGRATLLVGAIAGLLSVCIGIAMGALAGYYGGWADAALMRVTEFFQVLPALLFAMVVVSLFGPSLVTATLAIGLVSWPGTARIARGEFMRLRNCEFVQAERSIGAGNARIIWKVILPNASPPLVASGALAIGAAILFEGGLSFLGLGDPNQNSWGMMIGSSRPYVLHCWWAVAFPGAAIFLTVLSVSLIGDGLNDAFNPKSDEWLGAARSAPRRAGL